MSESQKHQLSALMRSTDSDRLLPLSIAAKRLGGWSTKTLRRWIEKRKIRAVKMPNRQWMIRESEIRRCLSNENIYSPQ